MRHASSSSPLRPVSLVGSALLIHASTDDLTSQPAGDSGGRISRGGVAAPTEEAMPASPVASAAAVSVENDVVNPEQIPFSEDMLGQLDVPEGFGIAVYSQGLENPRMMAFGPDGTLYVTEPAANNVVGLRDMDGDGQVDETIPAASNLPLVRHPLP